jgi:SagB-type dehydrogenase family enzyme
MRRRVTETDIAALFHLNSANTRTRLPDLSVDDDQRPPRFRTYPEAEHIPLPGQNLDELTTPLGLALGQRRSYRAFARKPLPLATLGRLLYASYGVRGYKQIEGEWTYDRNSPSAGGLYPLELYAAVQQVEGLSDGIYHYNARAAELELRSAQNEQATIAEMAIGQDMLGDANLIVGIAAVFARTMWKYGQRGYRYVWLDAGHVGQNLYLTATALNLGAAAVGGFFDRELGELFALPEDERMIYLVAIGQPAETSGD